MISLIYARSLNHCIGNKGAIPWHLPDEFAHFKNTTLGKPVIMGRKSYEDHKSLLPGRLNIVISRQQDYRAVEGVEVVQSLTQAISLASGHSEEIFIIGGVAMFIAAFPNATVVHETIVQTEIAGDTFLPEFDFGDWITELLQEHPADSRHAYPFKVYRHSRV